MLASAKLAGFKSPHTPEEVKAALERGDMAIVEAANTDHVVNLDPVEWDGYVLVNAMMTQWNRSFGGLPMGLRYEGLPVVASSYAVTLDAERMTMIRLLEAKMIEHWTKHREGQTPPDKPSPSG